MGQPISLQSARMLRKARQNCDRQVYEVGRFGIVRTEKRPGDWVWNGLKQEWEVVR